jgi:hypothetical protein
MKLYRIYTENKNKDFIKRLCDLAFDGYTLYQADGVWRGQHESSLVIEYLAVDYETEPGEQVENVARRIKEQNGQHAVLVTWHDIGMQLI